MDLANVQLMGNSSEPIAACLQYLEAAAAHHVCSLLLPRVVLGLKDGPPAECCVAAGHMLRIAENSRGRDVRLQRAWSSSIMAQTARAKLSAASHRHTSVIVHTAFRTSTRLHIYHRWYGFLSGASCYSGPEEDNAYTSLLLACGALPILVLCGGPTMRLCCDAPPPYTPSHVPARCMVTFRLVTPRLLFVQPRWAALPLHEDMGITCMKVNVAAASSSSSSNSSSTTTTTCVTGHKKARQYSAFSGALGRHTTGANRPLQTCDRHRLACLAVGTSGAPVAAYGQMGADEGGGHKLKLH